MTSPDFDPQPVELCGDVGHHLKIFLDKVCGQGLGVSLLLDELCRCWSYNLYTNAQLLLPSTRPNGYNREIL